MFAGQSSNGKAVYGKINLHGVFEYAFEMPSEY